MQNAQRLKKGTYGKEVNHAKKTPAPPLTHAEKRMRFYAWSRSYRKAEFINGKVVIDSPVRARHLWVSSRLTALLKSAIARFKPGAKVGVEKGMISFGENDFEPDVCYWGAEKAKDISEKQWKLPIPDFIAEILSPDSGLRDRGLKKDAYEKYKVSEYWIIDPEAKVIERYVLDSEGKYVLQADAEQVGISLMPGFTFSQEALFSDEASDETTQGLVFPMIQARLEAAEEKAQAAEAKAKATETELQKTKQEKAQQMRTFILFLRSQGWDDAQISTITGLNPDEATRLLDGN